MDDDQTLAFLILQNDNETKRFNSKLKNYYLKDILKVTMPEMVYVSSWRSCFDEASLSDELLILEPAMRKFVEEANHLSSVDGYLVKLETLILQVEDLSSYGKYDPKVVFKKMLSCRELVESLQPLSNYISDVEHLVAHDIRHKLLRPYLETLLEALRSIPPSTVRLVLMREPLERLEKEGSRREYPDSRSIHVQEPVEKRDTEDVSTGQDWVEIPVKVESREEDGEVKLSESGNLVKGMDARGMIKTLLKLIIMLIFLMATALALYQLR